MTEHRLVLHTAIAPGLVLHTTSIVEHADNGLTGDARVSLCVGERVDDGAREPFLRTNSGPMLIAVDAANAGDLGSASHACSLESAADALGVSRLSLATKLLEIEPGWAVSAAAFIE